MSERLATAASLVATMPTWRPHHITNWIAAWRGSPGALDAGMPWLAWSCIDWLEPRVRPGMRVLEFGGGGSTLFFLLRDCVVTTVEGNRSWADELAQRTQPFPGRSDVRFVDSQSGSALLAAAYAAEGRDGAPWDIILVDGAFRRACVEVARGSIAPGGLIIVDNTDLPEYAEVKPELVLPGFRRRVFRSLGFARVKPTTTEVYEAPR